MNDKLKLVNSPLEVTLVGEGGQRSDVSRFVGVQNDANPAQFARIYQKSVDEGKKKILLHILELVRC